MSREEVRAIIQAALARGQTALSEHDGKNILAAYGLPVTREILVQDLAGAQKAAQEIGFPVVLKVCSAQVAHKTEQGLIELDLRDAAELTSAFGRLAGRAGGLDGGFLVQEMVKGSRELALGLIRDPQFGPSLMFGLGGIFLEILRDVAFRPAPLGRAEALEMMAEIRGAKILGPVRGQEPADLEALSQALIGLGRIGLDHAEITQIDINPLILRRGRPVAVDALVVLDPSGGR